MKKRKTQKAPGTESGDSLPAVPSEIMRTPAAAAYLGVAPETLETWRSRSRQGPPYVRMGRLIGYRRAALDAWLDHSTAQSTSDYAHASA